MRVFCVSANCLVRKINGAWSSGESTKVEIFERSSSVLRKNENENTRINTRIVNGVYRYTRGTILSIVPPPSFYIRSVEVPPRDYYIRGWRATNRDGTHNVAEISSPLQRAAFIASTHLFASFVRNSPFSPPSFHRYIQFHLYPLSLCALNERNANYIITYVKPYRI